MTTVFNLSASTDLEKYYEIFYSEPGEYDNWLRSDKNDSFKDIFIASYRLPEKGVRKFSYDMQLRKIKSYSTDKEYAYAYIEVKRRTSFEMLISGIKKGKITINGAERGQISIDQESGYTIVKGVFEQGVYFFSIKINERFYGIPVIALSNRELPWSERRGFNRAASANVSIVNVNGKASGSDYAGLYKSFCFPHMNDKAEKREVFFKMVNRKKFDREGKNFLITVLSKLLYDEAAENQLKKIGFAEEQIVWWRENFLKGEVCKYDTE